MSSDLIPALLTDADEKMGKAVEHALADFSGVRTGRAAPALVEKLPVDYYGTEVPLQQLAGFTVPEARTLVISPYDKGAMGAIEKAIQHSDLGLNPSNDGQVLRLNFPQLTQERRKELVKVVKSMAEDGRVAIRNLRRSTRHDLESLSRDGDASEDDVTAPRRSSTGSRTRTKPTSTRRSSRKSRSCSRSDPGPGPVGTESGGEPWLTIAALTATRSEATRPPKVCGSSARRKPPKHSNEATWRSAAATTSRASATAPHLRRPSRDLVPCCAFRSVPPRTPARSNAPLSHPLSHRPSL